VRTKKQKSLIRQWVEALRSGRYRQTKGSLKKSWYNEYCCLGVACRVLGKSSSAIIKMNDENDGGLDEATQQTLGINERTVTTLIRANDSDGLDFKQIARKIERGLLR
jgi:hypothetical protein